MKTNNSQATWRETAALNIRALRMLFHQHPQMILSRFLLIIWGALTPYATVYLSALIIDELTGNQRVDRLRFLVLTLLISSACIALITALLTKWKQTHNSGLIFEIRHPFFKKSLELDYDKCDDPATAKLLSTIFQNENSSRWGLHRAIDSCDRLCSALFTMLGGVALTVSLFSSRTAADAGALAILDEPLVVLGVVVFMLAVTFIAPALQSKAESYWAINSTRHNISNLFFSFYSWHGENPKMAADVRIYEQYKISSPFFHNKDELFCSNGYFAHLARGRMGLFHAASGAVSVLFTGAAYAFVCLKALAGAFGLGAVSQYIASITKVSGGLSELFASLGEMHNNTNFLKPVFEFIDIPNDMYHGSLTVEKRRDRNYQVEFRNVSFKYPNSDSYALRHVSMKFEIGKRLAVVGMNGSGKTTFIKLLCRLYDPTEGEILLNGIDIRKYNYDEYLSLFSVVFQDFQLLALKLGQNVAAASDYDRDRATDALIRAGFGERLADWAEGTETYLYKNYSRDGVNVSGGEEQKIAIARTLYKDAPFIILDEPTAALDPVSEAEIYAKFNDIAGDKTAVYISHRLSSCKFCDEILVFHEGSVIQQGTHAELLANKDGKYHELWNAQAQYYTE